jgi:hypothetical protein
LKAIVDGYLELQYKIELGADGMIDGPPSDVGTAARMTALLDRRQAWAHLQWTERIPVPVPGSCRAYELVSGVFAESTFGDEIQGSRHFFARFLPSREDRHGLVIERRDIGLLSRDFAIDPTQDLISFVEIALEYVFPRSLSIILSLSPRNTGKRRVLIHLRTISLNHIHPLATIPVIHHTTPDYVPDAFIQIVDDVVGILISVQRELEVVIWNWKTGNLLEVNGAILYT